MCECGGGVIGFMEFSLIDLLVVGVNVVIGVLCLFCGVCYVCFVLFWMFVVVG